MQYKMLIRITARVFTPLLFVSIMAAVGCSEKQPKLSIEDSKVERSRTTADEMYVYLKIKNAGASDTLRSVTTSLRGAEGFISAVVDNRASRIDRVSIPAARTVEFRSGESHFVIKGMPKDAGPGDQFTLTLVFERSGERPLQLTIPRGPGGTAGLPDGRSITVRD